MGLFSSPSPSSSPIARGSICDTKAGLIDAFKFLGLNNSNVSLFSVRTTATGKTVLGQHSVLNPTLVLDSCTTTDHTGAVVPTPLVSVFVPLFPGMQHATQLPSLLRFFLVPVLQNDRPAKHVNDPDCTYGPLTIVPALDGPPLREFLWACAIAFPLNAKWAISAQTPVTGNAQGKPHRIPDQKTKNWNSLCTLKEREFNKLDPNVRRQYVYELKQFMKMVYGAQQRAAPARSQPYQQAGQYAQQHPATQQYGTAAPASASRGYAARRR